MCGALFRLLLLLLLHHHHHHLCGGGEEGLPADCIPSPGLRMVSESSPTMVVQPLASTTSCFDLLGWYPDWEFSSDRAVSLAWCRCMWAAITASFLDCRRARLSWRFPGLTRGPALPPLLLPADRRLVAEASPDGAAPLTVDAEDTPGVLGEGDGAVGGRGGLFCDPGAGIGDRSPLLVLGVDA